MDVALLCTGLKERENMLHTLNDQVSCILESGRCKVQIDWTLDTRAVLHGIASSATSLELDQFSRPLDYDCESNDCECTALISLLPSAATWL